MARGSMSKRTGIRAIRDRLRETGKLHWATLSRAGRVSIAGIVGSAVLALALGALIPRIAEHHVLLARLQATQALVRVLEQERLIPLIGDHLSGESYDEFDRVVRDGLLGGDNLRVKLWNAQGEIVYSDLRRLVGRRFEIGPDLRDALTGIGTVEISDLTDEENAFDRRLGDQLIEFYVPVTGPTGDVIGVFEIYQDSGPLAAHLTAIRVAVWITVGIGLFVLLVFLLLLFSATARAMEREHRAAIDHAEDLAVLLQTSEILSSEPRIERTAEEVLRILTSRLGLRCASLALEGSEPSFVFADLGPPTLCGLGLAAARDAQARGEHVERQGASLEVEHTDGHPRCSVLAVPFHVEPDLSGALVACRDADRPLDAREHALVSGVSGQLGVAAESAKLFRDLEHMTEERAHLLRRMVDAQEEERRHLVGDLHDGEAQTLTRVLYGLRGSRARLGPKQPEVDAELARLESLVDDLIVDLRRYMAAIRPAMIEDLGLSEALESFARTQEEEAGIQIDVRTASLPPLDTVTSVTLYRAVQEAVMNARKHAEAGRMWIDLAPEDGEICLRVRDDGNGSGEIRDGIGLTYMKDRVASLGGSVSVTSRPKEGTTVSVRIPVTA